VNPVIAVALGTLILNEPFTARIALAGAIVLAGMLLVRGSTGMANGIWKMAVINHMP
jgi:drug/metabolite transporter (DMT)-like permease